MSIPDDPGGIARPSRRLSVQITSVRRLSVERPMIVDRFGSRDARQEQRYSPGSARAGSSSGLYSQSRAGFTRFIDSATGNFCHAGGFGARRQPWPVAAVVCGTDALVRVASG